MSKLFAFVLFTLFLSSCSILSSRNQVNYELMLNLEKESEIEFQDWKEQTTQESSVALGMYRVRATPLAFKKMKPLNFEESFSVDSEFLELKTSCFYVELEVKSPYEQKARLENFEALLEDRWGLFYQLSWMVDSYESHELRPQSEKISGATGSEVMWRNRGFLCAYASVAFDDYFELTIRPLQTDFPFFGVRAKFVWDFEGVQFPEGHPSYHEGERKKEVQRYKGW